MGGDRAPEVVIEGAVRAIREGHGPILLVGDPARIEPELVRFSVPSSQLGVVPASEIIGMAEHPGRAARAKRDSSMHVGFRLVKEGAAGAFVSAGNSGAMMAVGLLTLRRLAGCDRPAIASTLPTRQQPVVLLDMGANVECRATHLVQFALMGAAYAEAVHGRERPRVGLLSNGTEVTKGTETLREAHRLLCTTDLRYMGFVEGRDIPQGDLDVVVTDGFVGNVVLKLSEGIALALVDKLRDTLRGDWLGTLGAALMRRSLRKLQSEVDWARVGGAPLLGLDGVAVVAHGGSDAQAISNAIRTARQLEPVDLGARIESGLGELGISADTTSTSELPLMARNTGSHEQPT